MTPPPERIGRYRILERLGHGAMGVVYRGRDEGLDRDVAVKVVRTDALDEESRAQFLKEARAAARLQHAAIVTIYELGEEGEVPYLAMELLHGQDLQRAMREGQVQNPVRALAVVEQVLAGLGHAHARGIVHRDMKPSNVFLHDGVHAKILDFGVARLGGSMTQTGRVVGTPHYMAPEQVRADAVDGRADLFSTALMFYEMVTGAKAYRQGSDISVMFQIVHADADLSKLPRTAVGMALRQVLRKALARDRDERYPDAGALSLALSAAVYTPDDGAFVEPEDPASFTAVSGVPEILLTTADEATPLPPSLRDAPDPKPAVVPHILPSQVPPRPRPPVPPIAAVEPPERPTGPSGLPLLETVMTEPHVKPASDWALGTSPPPSVMPAVVRPPRAPRSPRVWMAAGAIAVALIAGFVWWLRWIPGRPYELPPTTLAESAPSPVDAPPPTVGASAVPTAAPSVSVAPAPSVVVAPSAPPVAIPSGAPTRVAAATDPRPPPFGAMDVQARLDRATQLYEAGQLGTALAEARAVLRLQPDNTEAKYLADDIELDLAVEQRLKAARTALARGDREAARREAEAGLKLKPNESRLGALLREIDRP